MLFIQCEALVSKFMRMLQSENLPACCPVLTICPACVTILAQLSDSCRSSIVVIDSDACRRYSETFSLAAAQSPFVMLSQE
jgi:hypothetical protein